MNPTEDVFQLDLICSRFDTEWMHSDNPPELEHYLIDVDSKQRTHLIELLLEIDMEHRRRNKLRHDQQFYRHQLPQFADAVETALAKIGGAGKPESELPTRSGVESHERSTRSCGLDRTILNASARDLAAGRVLLGDFKLLEFIGRGGMGVVFKARQQSLERDVAVKVLPFVSSIDARAMRRFATEARAAASLKHPHIVPIHFVGTDSGVQYYAMELIEGNDLAKILHALADGEVDPMLDGSANSVSRPASSGDSLSGHPVVAHWRQLRRDAPREYFREIVTLVLDAADAIHFAHQSGVLHRDIKPGNLLLDHSGKVWVSDFGLARIESEESMTGTGDVVGTLAYMSPEQSLGTRELDARSDVYSLGATMTHLLTLKRLPPGDYSVPSHRSAKTTRARDLDSRLPLDLEWMIQKATAPQPDDRYQSAKELAEDLRRFLDGKRIEPLYRISRRGAIASLCGVACVGTVAGLVSYTRGDKGTFQWQMYDRSNGPFYAVAMARDANSSLTLETWVQLGEVSDSVLLSQSGLIQLGLKPWSGGSALYCQVTVGDEQYVRGIADQKILKPGEVAHAAACFDRRSGRLSLFVNGRKMSCEWIRLTYDEDVGFYQQEWLSTEPKIQPHLHWPGLGLSIGGLALEDGEFFSFPFLGKLRGQHVASEVLYKYDFQPPTGISIQDSTLAAYDSDPHDPGRLLDVSGNGMTAIRSTGREWTEV